MRDVSLWLVFGSFLCAVAACGAGAINAPPTLKVSSGAFSEGAAIPARFTCKGRDVSPAIGWKGLPVGTKSIALICDDPDAPMGTWVHWVLYNLPASVGGLPESVPATPTTIERRAAGDKQLGKDRVRRSMPASRQTAPIFLQGLRPGRDAAPQARRHQGPAVGTDEGPRPGQGPPDGHLSPLRRGRIPHPEIKNPARGRRCRRRHRDPGRPCIRVRAPPDGKDRGPICTGRLRCRTNRLSRWTLATRC